MSKTAEEILHEVIDNTNNPIHWKSRQEYDAIQAMHTYAEQMVVGFDLWKIKNGWQYLPDGRWWNFDSNYDVQYYTTADLYQLFIQQNQK